MAHFAPVVVLAKYAAFALFDTNASCLLRTQGFATKHPANPLLVQDRPWEVRLDNSYPNVAYDGGSRRYELFYSNGGLQVLEYANSSDGLAWAKPSLGVFNLSGREWVPDALRPLGAENNIVMRGMGVGVRDDRAREGAGAPCAFKAFGEGQFTGALDDDATVDGVGCSADGLQWGAGAVGGAVAFPDPQVRETTTTCRPPPPLGERAPSRDASSSASRSPTPLPLLPSSRPRARARDHPQRYDTHNNVVWHAARGEYLYTTRSGFSGSPGRSIGMALGERGAFAPDAVDADGFATTFEGADDAQLYAQLTFPFLDVWLAHVMVYEADDAAQRVRCRLAYSRDGLGGWAFVASEADPLRGAEFVPLGGGAPACATWAPVVDATGRNASDCAAYRAGATPNHTICHARARSAAAPDAPLAACRAACDAAPSCAGVQWEGLRETGFDETAAGQCWFVLDACAPDAQVAYSNPDFCVELEACAERAAPPAGGDGAFDSHICFAAATPFADADGVARVYYMGGNGPHSGERNTSLGLATLPSFDRLAGLRGTGRAVAARAVPVAASALTVTADGLAPGASVRVGAVGVAGLGLDDCPALALDDANATDAPLGLDFSALVGTNVTLELELVGAVLYSVGFADDYGRPLGTVP